MLFVSDEFAPHSSLVVSLFGSGDRRDCVDPGVELEAVAVEAVAPAENPPPLGEVALASKLPFGDVARPGLDGLTVVLGDPVTLGALGTT